MGCRCALSFFDRSQLRSVDGDTPRYSAASFTVKNSLSFTELSVTISAGYQTLPNIATIKRRSSVLRYRNFLARFWSPLIQNVAMFAVANKSGCARGDFKSVVVLSVHNASTGRPKTARDRSVLPRPLTVAGFNPPGDTSCKGR